MANVPYPLTAGDIEELRGQIYELIRQVYEEKIGGADLGDVFSLPGDVLTLAISATGGMTKTGNELGIKLADTSLTMTSAGVKVTTAISGATGTVTVVTAIQAGGAPGPIQYKTRDLTIASGLVSTIGAETGWTDL